MNKNNNYSFSPGKIIISGEHSVVYGQKALVTSVNLGIDGFILEENSKQEKKGYLAHIFNLFENQFKKNTSNLAFFSKSNLPMNSGMGSSAAFAHVVLLSLLEFFQIKLEKQKIFEFVFECEKFAHGNPSGVDPAAVVFQGLQVFQKIDGQIKRAKLVNNSPANNLPDNNLTFTLIQSGKSLETTKEMVEVVRENIQQNKELEKVIHQIGEVTEKIIKQFEQNNFDGSLLNVNNQLLEKIGVVGNKAKDIISTLNKNDIHAKITGAGGLKDGSGLILAYSKDNKKIKDLASKNNWEFFEINI